MKTVKPSALLPNSRIGVFAPASAPLDPLRLTKGLDALRARGLAVVFNESELSPTGYLSAPDPVRSAALNTLLGRDDLSALIAVRGGYGVMRLLDSIDFDASAGRPKLIVGYSDITALQFAFYTRCGWTSVQGPMVAVEWPNIEASTESHFWRLVGGETMHSLAGPGDEQLAPVRSGISEGVLLGGNLATIVRLIGTPYLPSFDDAILFLEDVGEQPYRIDALLAQLRLSGILNRLRGVVLGAFTQCNADPERPSFSTTDVLKQYFEDAPYPVAEGLVYGHIPHKISMPFGIRARLSVSDHHAELSMLEAVTGTEHIE